MAKIFINVGNPNAADRKHICLLPQGRQTGFDFFLIYILLPLRLLVLQLKFLLLKSAFSCLIFKKAFYICIR